MSLSSTQLMKVAVQAACAAASVVMTGCHKPMVIATKWDFHDMVTEFDRASEEKIHQILLQALPSS